MPNGITHDKITYITTPMVALGTSIVTGSTEATILVSGAYLFSGLMFSGDLDLPSVQYYRWKFLRFIWRPYQKMFSHRSIWTHWPLLGTIVRILYLYLWFSIGLFGVNLFSTSSTTYIEIQKEVLLFLTENQYYVISLFIGMVLGSFSHSAADYSVSWYKKKHMFNKKILRNSR